MAVVRYPVFEALAHSKWVMMNDQIVALTTNVYFDTKFVIGFTQLLDRIAAVPDENHDLAPSCLRRRQLNSTVRLIKRALARQLIFQ